MCLFPKRSKGFANALIGAIAVALSAVAALSAAAAPQDAPDGSTGVIRAEPEVQPEVPSPKAERKERRATHVDRIDLEAPSERGR